MTQTDSAAGLQKRPDRVKARQTRAQKAEATRLRLFDAAVAIVGESGYAATSVAMITARAKVAQGTFYNYFESRQDLLDQLLPAISKQLHKQVRLRVLAAPDHPLARERARMEGFFEFLEEAPHLFKMLSEGPVQAPKGFHQHLEQQSASYYRALEYELAQGNLKITDADELSVVVQMLLASREYLSARFCYFEDKFIRPPAYVVEAYMKMVTGSLFK